MIRERNPAQSGRKLGIALFKLAQAYERLSRFEDAIALCERGTPNVEKFEGPEPSSNTAYWN